MVLLAARLLARLLALILTTALAVAGLALAVFSIQGDSSTLSLPSLARHARLADLRDVVGTFLAALEAPGPIAKVAALAGAGALLLGLMLLLGVLGRRRERLIVIRRDDDGRIAARTRAVAQAAVILEQQRRDVVGATARIRARRRGIGGRMRLTVEHRRSVDVAHATRPSDDHVGALAQSLSLRLRVRDRASRRGARVR